MNIDTKKEKSSILKKYNSLSSFPIYLIDEGQQTSFSLHILIIHKCTDTLFMEVSC